MIAQSFPFRKNGRGTWRVEGRVFDHTMIAQSFKGAFVGLANNGSSRIGGELAWFGIETGNDPFCVAALLAPSAFTAGSFVLGQRSAKPLAPTYGPYAALRGPLATASCGPARPTTCCASLHLAPPATPEGAAHLALQTPPLGLLRSRVDQDQKPDQEPDQKPEQRLANRCALAVYLSLCVVADSAVSLSKITPLQAPPLTSRRQEAERRRL